MPAGFSPVRTGNELVDRIQQNLASAIAPLAAAASLTFPVATLAASTQLSGEDVVVIYAGPAGATLTLPAANVRKAGTATMLFVGNRGAATVTLAASGGDSIMGLASLALTVGSMRVLVSDGAHYWFGDY